MSLTPSKTKELKKVAQESFRAGGRLYASLALKPYVNPESQQELEDILEFLEVIFFHGVLRGYQEGQRSA